MKKLCVGLFLGFVLAAIPSTAFAQLSAFQGNWRNNDPATGGVTRLQIGTSPNVTVHAWGKCSPSDCDLGVRVVRSSPVGNNFVRRFVKSEDEQLTE